MKEKFYITTAIAYASGKPHIGNTYEAILADAIARFKRCQGYDVFFLTGTDEHGQKIEEKAKAKRVTPKQYVDKEASEIKALWDMMGVSYDRFIRTTDDYHEEQVAKIFKKLYDQGDIYKGAYEGWYCTPCESFWTESQLKDGKCPDCGREVTKAKEEAYFFKMSKYADRLVEYYEGHPDFIIPISRKNEMINNFIKPGLQDLCVSRSSFTWGVPVSFDKKHVVYVWLDALVNYITGIGYDAEGKSKKDFEKFWPANVHIVGKDIIRFHTIYWPIFLMALGLPLPQQVYGHGWLLQEGGKMSKSKGNVLYADDLTAVFGKDAIRYYVLSAMPQDNDGLISWETITESFNTDLANILGNLVSRTIAMINKYFGGTMSKTGKIEPVDKELQNVVKSAYKKVCEKMNSYRIADAISEIFTVFRRANKYIDETTPWILAKEERSKQRLSEVLYNLAESIITGASLFSPFMPDTADKIAKEFGTSLKTFKECEKFGTKHSYTVIENADILYARLDIKDVEKKAEETAKRQQESVSKAEKSQNGAYTMVDKKTEKQEISIEDFAKVQLKVALVIACEKVEKSKKLLKLTLKVGEEQRTVVSGIATKYTPEYLVGKKIVVITNLKPAKLCGIESQGMILCAEDSEENIVFLSPEKDIADGSTIS